ncbi:MAG TPA: hypothetical protein VEG30_09380 [Terriglobales bacterium]|nr:hypothetical protein [Terriglobales bacterium]
MRKCYCSSCTVIRAMVLVAIVVAATFSGRAQDDVYQLSFYANANSQISDQTINILNPGWQGAPLSADHGTVCADIYVFDANQELETCCACRISANGILTLSLRLNLLPAAAFPGGRRPDTGVIKIVSDALANCNATHPNPVPQLRTSMTHLELAPPLNLFRIANSESDVPFADSFLSQEELVSLAQRCHKAAGTKRVCLCPASS